MKYVIVIALAILCNCADKSPVSAEAGAASVTGKIKIVVNNPISQADDYVEIKVFQNGALIDLVMPSTADTIYVNPGTIRIVMYSCSVKMPSACSSCGPRVTRNVKSVIEREAIENETITAY